MNGDMFSFFIVLISGFSTLLGFVFIYIKTNENKLISSSLFLASGVMITVSLFDLLPNSYKYINLVYFSLFTILLIIIFVILGIIISNLLNNITNKISNKKLYNLGLLNLLIIFLHNLPEGIITFLTTNYDFELGLKVALAIALHNIPEGICIAVPIYFSTRNKLKTFVYTFISSIGEPIGALIAFCFLQEVPTYILGFLYALTSGIMLNIVLSELIPNGFEYKKGKEFLLFFIGILIIIFTSFCI